MGCTFAVTYCYHASEYHCRGQYLLPGEDVHADTYAYHNGYYGLDVAIHADKRRPYAFLAYRYEEIAYECGTYDEICQSQVSLPSQA